MLHVIGIDPGLRELGLSVFRGPELVHARLVRNPELKLRGPTAWWNMARKIHDIGLQRAREGTMRDALALVDDLHIVTEYPQVYDPKHQKGDQGDLIEVAGIAGAIAGLAHQAHLVVGYLPREWKGQVPKPIHNRRVMSKLSDAERVSIVQCAPDLMHNVIDAIGIGLFYLKELGARS